MTYPENLQEIVDEAFIAVNKGSLFCTPMGNLWACEAQQRLDIAKRILSAVGFTEPKPPFQLPPPPPGMKWHREDGWTEEMLPQGWRPVALYEKMDVGSFDGLHEGEWVTQQVRCTIGECHDRRFYRTKRPLTFTHEGHEWTWHRPGDPRPVDAATSIDVVMHENHILRGQKVKEDETWFGILGWRYADVPKSELEIIKEEVKNLVQRIKKLEYGEG